MDGRIRFTGKLDESGKAIIDIEKLSKGQYQVFIIDQGKISKKIIQIS